MYLSLFFFTYDSWPLCCLLRMNIAFFPLYSNPECMYIICNSFIDSGRGSPHSFNPPTSLPVPLSPTPSPKLNIAERIFPLLYLFSSLLLLLFIYTPWQNSFFFSPCFIPFLPPNITTVICPINLICSQPHHFKLPPFLTPNRPQLTHQSSPPLTMLKVRLEIQNGRWTVCSSDCHHPMN